ncbi:iron permease [Epithele typhae]|uniref:iron permease n=1 Tax=Epithele typhae TaxID=378194 RepID=UPI0020089CA9|nr:iron permease [Epithele typhae]KAH9933591.1 iron permease [Epithele typhae]
MSSAARPKGSVFWLSYTSVVVCNFLSALDVTAVSTALPTITKDLNGGEEFVWVGAAYNLAAAAILPFTGQLADIIGRRPIMLACVGFFFLGSLLCATAQNMHWLIAARTVQGIGGGGIINLASIITSDLVPLAERGLYQGLLVLTWAFAAGVGPVIGGSFAQKVTWRWLFYLNLPLAGIAFFLAMIFLRVRTPEGSLREKISRIDFVGNFIIIAGTTLALVALTWGGIRYPWSSAHVLAPLILGFLLIFLFFVYEAFFAKHPALPLDILANRTSLAGYIGTFFHGIASIALIYYLPVYFQACKDASPIRSSVDIFPTAFILSPFAIVFGVLVRVMKKYRPANVIGWAFLLIGFGLLTLLKADSSTGEWVGFQIITAVGLGVIWATTVYPILAPLPVARSASALAFYNFARTFAQTWGVAISASVLQNELKANLPADFLRAFPAGVEIAYAAIPAIATLPQPLRDEVRAAFATSMASVWKAMLGFCAAGALSVALMREVPMQSHTDDAYGLDEGGKAGEGARDSEEPDEKRAAELSEEAV